MNEKLSKKEILCGINVFPVLKYLEDMFGYKKMKLIVEDFGLTINYLLNKNNRVSYDYFCLLLDKLAEVTGDEDACYKVFVNNSKKTFFGGYYVSYPLNYFKSNGMGIKFKYLLLVQKKISRISRFDIVSSGNAYLKIKIIFNAGIKINRNFIKAFRGFLASLTIEHDIPPADVRITDEDDAERSFTYLVKWSGKYEKFLKFIFPSAVLFLESGIYYFLKDYIALKDFLICAVSTGFIYVIVMYIINIIKNRKNEKNDNARDFIVIDAVNHIEEDYLDQNNHINDLIENNKYLSIINRIRKFNDSLYLNTCLFEISKILLKQLYFTKALYFQYDFTGDRFDVVYELDNEEIYDMSNNNIKQVLNSLNLDMEKYGKLCSLDYFNTSKSIIRVLNIKTKDLKGIFGIKAFKYINLLPVSIKDSYYGLFVFFSENSDLSYNKMVTNVFNSIREQVGVLFEMISKRKIVENILSSVPSYVLILDINNMNVRYANNVFISAFPGLSKDLGKEDIIGRSIFSIINMSDHEKGVLIKSVKNLVTEDKVVRSIIKAGSKMIEYNLFLVSQGQNADRSAGIIMNDITEAKYFQDHILINEKLIALGTVACGVAHEINNPLFGILADAEEIASICKNDGNAVKYANEIVDLVMNITNIVKDLSVYSKTIREEEMAEVDLNEVIDDSIKLISYSLNIDEIKIEKDFSGEAVIKTKKGEMQQIFINLFNNAIYAMDGTGTIGIKTYAGDNEIKVSVSDTGCGIRDEDKPKIFDLFYTTKKAGEGTGMGLHIIKKIVERYNGKISFTSETGKGTVFNLIFMK